MQFCCKFFWSGANFCKQFALKWEDIIEKLKYFILTFS